MNKIREVGYYWVYLLDDPQKNPMVAEYREDYRNHNFYWEFIGCGAEEGNYCEEQIGIISGPLPPPREEEKMDNKEYVDKVNAGEYPESIVVPLDKPFEDNRGIIQNLWLGQSGSVTIIKSKKGAIRAKHKHTNDFHAAYILNGLVKYVEGEPGNKQQEFIFKAGDMFFTRPGVYHIMEFLEDGDMLTINGIVKNHGNYENDIKRY